MNLRDDVKKILGNNIKILDKHNDLKRINEMIKEKQEKGIIPKNNISLSSLQDVERHNYSIYFR